MTVSVVLAAILAARAGAVRADTGPGQATDLDGLQLWLGPSGAATRIEAGWQSTWGAAIGLVRVREARRVAVAGAWLGGAHYASRDGGRLWLDAVAGTRLLGGLLVGVAAGPAIELAGSHHPRPGASIALWGFGGIQPMVRLGWLDGSGAFVEVGASLAIPALRW